jgi:hypothetical protein
MAPIFSADRDCSNPGIFVILKFFYAGINPEHCPFSVRINPYDETPVLFNAGQE